MYNVINDKLIQMEEFVDNYFNSCALRSTQTSLTDLRERFKKKFTVSAEEQSDEFFYLYSKFREETSATKGWTPNTAEIMERLEAQIKEFKSDMKFSDLSTATMDALKEHLSKTMYNDALIKRLTYFKQFVKWAHSKNYEVHEEFFTYNPVLPKSKKINPLIGNAGVSAVPMSARISNNVGLQYDPSNYLLMHAMGPNVAGVIGSAVAAGALLGFLG